MCFAVCISVGNVVLCDLNLHNQIAIQRDETGLRFCQVPMSSGVSDDPPNGLEDGKTL